MDRSSRMPMRIVHKGADDNRQNGYSVPCRYHHPMGRRNLSHCGGVARRNRLVDEVALSGVLASSLGETKWTDEFCCRF